MRVERENIRATVDGGTAGEHRVGETIRAMLQKEPARERRRELMHACLKVHSWYWNLSSKANRPQFPPILFSKQVCKTQFSCRLTSHLIARWSMLSLFSSSLLRSVHNFSLYFSLTLPLSLSQSSACHFFSSTNNSFFLLHSRQRSWRGDK